MGSEWSDYTQDLIKKIQVKKGVYSKIDARGRSDAGWMKETPKHETGKKTGIYKNEKREHKKKGEQLKETYK